MQNRSGPYILLLLKCKITNKAPSTHATDDGRGTAGAGAEKLTPAAKTTVLLPSVDLTLVSIALASFTHYFSFILEIRSGVAPRAVITTTAKRANEPSQ
jgi:hypothetical protein